MSVCMYVCLSLSVCVSVCLTYASLQRLIAGIATDGWRSKAKDHGSLISLSLFCLSSRRCWMRSRRCWMRFCFARPPLNHPQHHRRLYTNRSSSSSRKRNSSSSNRVGPLRGGREAAARLADRRPRVQHGWRIENRAAVGFRVRKMEEEAYGANRCCALGKRRQWSLLTLENSAIWSPVSDVSCGTHR